jgi:hypothetical protein
VGDSANDGAPECVAEKLTDVHSDLNQTAPAIMQEWFAKWNKSHASTPRAATVTRRRSSRGCLNSTAHGFASFAASTLNRHDVAKVLRVFAEQGVRRF